ncbi:hypothetical protein QBC33DRAFT_551950 [Phialemonium atrogriseum]|uniref:Uncharacterized protein n=1 Tax=Phialemonium atrogriseum TaxID=1093897 RepID=A0AAJ0BSA7_9PEZI|nr:uncharacterized protein QBC33DRAFT_551950 [Phialemonium atrogriseum]KAK1762468.1 hypothetical protein QBC33DRAFT_551950 [Phialemonium atrogriseum]
MHLLNFPIEIRLLIYSELLVQDSPVELVLNYGPCNPRLFRFEGQGLNPALLRVNKTVNEEAIAFLYSNNGFRFPDAYTSFNTDTDSISDNSDGSDGTYVPCIAPFLQQIGANAALLRHICINFPTSFDSANWENPFPCEEYLQVLQLIRETCPGLRTVEISSKPPGGIFSLRAVDRAAEMLRALDDGGFKAMPSLEKIVVVREEYDIDEEVMALRESIMQRMPSCKWSIELTKVLPDVWTSCDDRVVFDNYEDCWRYDAEMLNRQMEREEREHWEEECYHRRNDPYWKNDSDYD